MNGSHQNYPEWLSAEIDGELSEEEKILLNNQLRSDAEARNLKTQLTRLTEVLHHLEEVEPPADLSESIMAAVPTVRRAGARPVRSRFWFTRSPVLRYGYAVAAGVILGLLLDQAILKRTSETDVSHLYGALAPRASASGLQPADAMRFESEELSGSVQLARLGSAIILEFEFTSKPAVEVAVKFDPGLVEFTGYNQKTPGDLSLTGAKGRLIVSCGDRQHFLLLLTSLQKVPTALSVEFLVSGRIVEARTLRMP